MNKKQTLTGAVLTAFLVSSAVAQAQPDPQLLEQLQKQLDAQEAALKQTRQQLERLQLQYQKPPQATRQSEPQQVSQQKPQPATQQPSRSQTQQTQQKRVGQAPPDQQKSEAAKVAPVLEQPGILTPKGHFALEPSLQYSYSSHNRVDLIGFTVLPAIIVGLIDVREVKSYSLVASLTARYGLTDRLEAELKVPYVYRHEETVGRPYMDGAPHDYVFNSSGSDIGDIEFALRYQFNQGSPSIPYFIGSLRGIFPTGKGPFDVDYSENDRAPGGGLMRKELPTGSGFYGIETGLLAIYPSDPVVFYGGVNYLWRLSRNVDKDIGDNSHIGKVDPGDSVKFNFGMGLALNERSSLSLGYQHTYIGKTKIDSAVASDATSLQLGQLMIGYAYQFSPDTSLNLTVGAGLTSDTPDAELTLRVPVSF